MFCTLLLTFLSRFGRFFVFFGLLLGLNQTFAFSLDVVASKAKKLAQESYQEPKKQLPAGLRNMTFIDYNKIQFDHMKSYWNDLNVFFKMEFYPQGMYFDTPVTINEITATTVHTIRYNSNYFNASEYHKEKLKDLGFAGFKILYPINEKNKYDEIISLLGASYFRAIGKEQVYGISSRGLAINTSLPSGEEFPRFREFWVERPKERDNHLVFYALLDSPSATGAYRFVLYPGRSTIVDVKARVFFRSQVGVLGIAPLTSMYLFGTNQFFRRFNYRPQLHDSDGLSLHFDHNQWIWRPLNNPERLQVSFFQIKKLKGFGLLQRTRDFFQYQDIEDRYDLRPSAWVVPQGEWSSGHIQLLEIPTNDETNDNVVVFWVPERLPKKGEEITFSYKVYFTKNEEKFFPKNLAWVRGTVISQGEIRQSNLVRKSDGSIALLIDFVGPVLKKLNKNTFVTTQVNTDSNTNLLENTLKYNPVTKGWRLILRVKIKNTEKPGEIQATLLKDSKPLSETWSYQLHGNG